MPTVGRSVVIQHRQYLVPGRGRIRSREAYSAFKESIAWACKAKLPKFEGPVSVRLLIVFNPRMDAQNIIKPCLDALELAGVIDNDKQVRRFSFYREDRMAKKEDLIVITVQEVK